MSNQGHGFASSDFMEELKQMQTKSRKADSMAGGYDPAFDGPVGGGGHALHPL